MARRTCLSAISVSSRRLMGPLTRRVMMGSDCGSCLVMMGGRDGIFEWQHHSGDNFFGSCAGQAHFYVHSGGVGFGKKINGQATVGKHAEGHQECNEHYREDGVLYTCFCKLHGAIGS